MEPNSSGMAVTESRSAPRFPFQWPVELKNGSGKTRDISASGMYLESDVPVEQGEQLRFSVLLSQQDGASRCLQCEGRAVRVERRGEGYFGVGVALQLFNFSNLGHMVA